MSNRSLLIVVATSWNVQSLSSCNFSLKRATSGRSEGWRTWVRRRSHELNGLSSHTLVNSLACFLSMHFRCVTSRARHACWRVFTVKIRLACYKSSLSRTKSSHGWIPVFSYKSSLCSSTLPLLKVILRTRTRFVYAKHIIRSSA
jgi:hypothetical protein